MKLRSRLSRAVLATAGCCCAPTPLLADAGALAIVPAEVTTSALTKTGAGTLLLNSASTTINAGTITSSAIHAGVLSLDGGTLPSEAGWRWAAAAGRA